MRYDPAKLRQLMDTQGRRNDWLAGRIGVSTTLVARVLAGQRTMTERFALAAAEALQVPVDFLLSDDREPANV